MPANPYRRYDLHVHLIRSTKAPTDLAYARHHHPDWPQCAAKCGWPVNPAAGDTHPICDPTPQNQPPARAKSQTG